VYFLALLSLCAFSVASFCQTSNGIPAAAWRRPIGLPLANAGVAWEAGSIDDGYLQGAPVGGFGSGTFSRTYGGNFARWHMKAGVNQYEIGYANQFAMYQRAEGEPGVAQVLVTNHPAHGELSSWKWDYPVGAGEYAALYPKSWFDYRSKEFPVHVVLEQFSPVLPNNYRESSYPVAVYRWHADNPTNKTVTVSLLLSWTNMSGWFRTFAPDFSRAPNQGNFDSYKSETISPGEQMKGIVFDRKRAGSAPNEWDGQFAVAALQTPGVQVSYQSTFDAMGDGHAVWSHFATDGTLADDNTSWVSDGEKLAGAIAVRFTLKPGEHKIVPMVIAWDFPVVQFGEGRKWYRHYTDFYGTDGRNAWKIARDGLLQGDVWSGAIDAWQAPYVNDASEPLWYRGMLFNELYILTDGGSFWGRQVGADPKTPSSFALLECYDYAYYATLDVRFYASLPLLKFWPAIDKQVLREFAATVPKQWPEKGLWVWKTQLTGKPVLHMRKKIGAVPHDLGVPAGDPFISVNEPGWQDTNDWKDLNSKFVLMVYRDYVLTGSKDKALLRETWPAVKDAIQYLRQFDSGGGIPENSGYPDQTYDDWVVKGVSAYSGGLWLAALRAAEETARTLSDTQAEKEYHELFLKGQKTYIGKLWNGEYFRYDTEPGNQDAIQTDQLAGQWYANMLGLGDLVPHTMQVSALKTIFDHNVMRFGNGTMGAVNGMTTNGTIIDNPEGKEAWVGTTEAYAALLKSEGMKAEAYKTLWGLYNVIYVSKGYWFRTPESWDINGNFRASMYMRPSAIWAVEMVKPTHELPGK